jgi:hypothetical protein
MTPHDLEVESYVFWRAHGCDHLHACAWLGNEAGETSFRTDRPVGDRSTGGAYGPVQHHQARIDIIKAATGIDIKTAPHIDQLTGILWEVTSSKEYGKTYGRFLATKTMEDAISVLVRQVERSGNQERDIRRRTALGNFYMNEFRAWDKPSGNGSNEPLKSSSTLQRRASR